MDHFTRGTSIDINVKAGGYAAIAVNPATPDLVVKLVGVAV